MEHKRAERLRAAAANHFDIAIIGGGIHGASIAREAALRGYSVLLVDARDYAAGTSSRSSKMIHGGVRYLETLDFSLVHEALSERTLMLKNAPHLVRSSRFLYPVISGLTRPAWQIRFGLLLYDLLSRESLFGGLSATFPRHQRLSPDGEQTQFLRNQGLQFEALFAYSDGQLDDARFTIETVIDSSSLGAVTLNYVELMNAIAFPARAGWELHLRDVINGEEITTRAKFLVNMAGPSAKVVHERLLDRKGNPALPSFPAVVLSKGSHLVFNSPWKADGVILPTPTRGRYYFIWPYFTPGCETLTLVGTTDREISTVEPDPVADEVDEAELLTYLKRDLPSSSLNSDTLIQSFAGIRLLLDPRVGASGRIRKRGVSAISRRDHWVEHYGYLSLIGGKFTTARNTAERAVNRIDEYFLRNSRVQTGTRTRPLPGGVSWDQTTRPSLERRLSEHLTIEAQRLGLPPSESAIKTHAQAAVSRFGTQAEKLLGHEFGTNNPFISSSCAVLRSEIRLAILEEQAITVEDVLRRRLSVSLHPGAGRDLVATVTEELARLTGRATQALENEAREYLRRWK